MLKALWISFVTFCSMSLFGQQNCRPNIIIIYADDLGYGDLSCYGGNIPTPNIDRIGKNGIRFTDFYVAAPVCTPSRFSLLTGSYPQRSQHDLTGALMPFDKKYLDPSETTLPEYLKTKGFNTALIGKWHLGKKNEADLPTNHGFDTFYGHMGGCIDYFHHSYGKLGLDWFVDGNLKSEEGYATNLLTDHAINYVEKIKNETDPFFLFLSYNAPHYGKSDPDCLPDHTVVLQEAQYKGIDIANTLQAPGDYYDRFGHIKDPYRRMYAAMISNLDDNVGRLMNTLRQEGLHNNTMIWFISDNGGTSESLHGHASNRDLRGEKGTLWEGGIRVPAMVSWKDKIKPAQIIDIPICNIDIVPTIASIIGSESLLPEYLVDGQDITEVLLKEQKIERDIFWKYRNQTAIRSGNWKLLNNEMLFNLEIDKFERNDVAAEYPCKVMELQKRLKIIENSFF